MKLRSGKLKRTVNNPRRKKKVFKKVNQLKELRVVLERITVDELRKYIIDDKKLRRPHGENATQSNSIDKNASMSNNNQNHTPRVNNQLRQEALATPLPEENQRSDEEERDEEEEEEEQQQQHVRNTRRKMADLCMKPEKLNLKNGNLAENWKRFKRQFENFMIATESNEKSDAIKIAMFLNLIGDEAMDVLDSLNLTEAQRQAYDETITAMENFCKPRRNTVYERYIFYHRNQNDGEPFDTFLMDIRYLATSCEFGAAESEMLRDRIVMGINDNRLQSKLLESNNLTYDAVVEKCRANEVTKQQSQKMNKTAAVNEVRSTQNTQQSQQNRNSTNNNKREESMETQQRSSVNNRERFTNQSRNINNTNNNRNAVYNDKFHCKFCNFIHRSRECPAYGKTCNSCSKKNHFSSVCRTRSVTTIERHNDCIPDFGSLNNSDSNSCNNDNNEFYVGSLEKRIDHAESDVEFMSPWLEKIQIGKHSVAFKIDTGAEIDVLPLNIFKRFCPGIELRHTNVTLRAFGGTKIMPVGMCYLFCQYKNMTLNVMIAVVDIDITPILGLSTSARFNIVNPPRSKNNEMKINKHSL